MNYVPYNLFSYIGQITGVSNLVLCDMNYMFIINKYSFTWLRLIRLHKQLFLFLIFQFINKFVNLLIFLIVSVYISNLLCFDYMATKVNYVSTFYYYLTLLYIKEMFSILSTSLRSQGHKAVSPPA